MERRENEVTGKCGFDRDFSSFEVANLTDENNIGILAQERSECSGEVQTDLLFHLDLVDTRKVELNRVFRSHDVRLDRVQWLKRGIERVCLTASSWSSDEHHAVRLRNISFELNQRFRFESEFGHVEHEVLFVQ